MTGEERGMGNQNALLCATEYRRYESRLIAIPFNEKLHFGDVANLK